MDISYNKIYLAIAIPNILTESTTFIMCEIAVGSMFRNNAPYLKEWIEYHLMIGVDRFYLADDRSTDNWKEILDPYITRGIVIITHTWLEETSSWAGRQMNTFYEIAAKYKDSTTWMAFIDTDEFIVPVNYKYLRDCLQAKYSEASAVYMMWRNFGTSRISIPPSGTPEYPTLLDKLTYSSLPKHSYNITGKTIYRTCDSLLSLFWSPHFVPLERGFYYDGDGVKNTRYKHGSDQFIDFETKHKNAELYIHHYAHRDETYFRNVRLPREGAGPSHILEHYEAFNMQKNVSMLTYIQKFHQESTMWPLVIPAQLYTSWSDACAQITADPEVFRVFKQKPSVKGMLEHLDHGSGIIYKQLCEKHLSLAQIKELVEYNDRHGMPNKAITDGIIGSASSFRYVFHAIEILQLYKSPVPMVEIGGGYGGLCLIILKLAKMLNVHIPMYHICDLPNANTLQELYLSKHSLKVSHIFPLDSAFVISNYALSEIPQEVAAKYIEKIIPIMNGGYFAWNTDSDISWIPTSVEITDEYPQTGNNNKILKCIKTDAYVSVDLMGGLGNKLFQLAAAASYALQTNKILTFVNTGTNPHNANDPDISKLVFPQCMLTTLDLTLFQELSEETQFVYAKLPCFPGHILLKGYFQAHQYIHPYVRELIRAKICRDLPIDKYFLHIRRGDYLSVPHLHIDLTDHYVKSHRKIMLRDPSARFIVFSDDIPYCRKYMQTLFPGARNITYSAEPSAIKTVSMMAACKGGICANSTLSWWGANLGNLVHSKNPYYLPKPWISDESPQDLYFM